MFKLKFKQKMKPNFLLCLTLRRKRPKSVSLLGLTSLTSFRIYFFILTLINSLAVNVIIIVSFKVLMFFCRKF